MSDTNTKELATRFAIMTANHLFLYDEITENIHIQHDAFFLCPSTTIPIVYEIFLMCCLLNTVLKMTYSTYFSFFISDILWPIYVCYEFSFIGTQILVKINANHTRLSVMHPLVEFYWCVALLMCEWKTLYYVHLVQFFSRKKKINWRGIHQNHLDPIRQNYIFIMITFPNVVRNDVSTDVPQCSQRV